MSAKNHESITAFGNECQLNDGILLSKVLFGMNKKGAMIVWQIYIGVGELIDSEDPSSIVMNQVEPTMYQNHTDIADYLVGTYWTKHGQIGGKKQEAVKTIIYQGKNVGKKNATNAFTQALYDAKSLYESKIKDGYMINKADLIRQNNGPTFDMLMSSQARGEFSWRVYSMAIQNYRKFSKKINFPAVIQPKYDGHSCIVVGDTTLTTTQTGQHISGIDIYGRGRESYTSIPYIADDMAAVIAMLPKLHFVGELWAPGLELQDISSIVRHESYDSSKPKINFNIFDCFYLEGDLLVQSAEVRTLFARGFVGRQEFLREYVAAINNHVRTVTTAQVCSDDQVYELYDDFIADGLEGAVVRNLDAPYEYSVNKEARSYFTQKLKPRDDAEWPIVGYTSGKGKETGLVIWQCAETDDGCRKRLELIKSAALPALNDRLTFTVTPNLSNDIRRAIYNKLEADPGLVTRIIGAMATIFYSIISKDGLPQQPKMKGFRDVTISEELSI
jgi:hypothetical protein